MVEVRAAPAAVADGGQRRGCGGGAVGGAGAARGPSPPPCAPGAPVRGSVALRTNGRTRRSFVRDKREADDGRTSAASPGLYIPAGGLRGTELAVPSSAGHRYIDWIVSWIYGSWIVSDLCVI